MSPARVTMRRTVGIARGLYSTAFAVAAFLSASAALFAFNLDASEGGRSSLASIWAVSASPFLPALAALLGMGTWSDERVSGRLDILLSTPVKERELVAGKFLGAWTLSTVSLAVSLAASVAFLRVYAPRALDGVPLSAFVPAFLFLSLQNALWCAAASAASAFFRSAAAAATATVAVLVAVPRGAWLALSHWSGPGRPGFGAFPPDAQAWDFATGLVSLATVFTYAILAWAALFAATKAIEGARFADRASSGRRISGRTATVLALVFAALASTLAQRFDLTLDLPVGGTLDMRFSDRTRSVLSSSSGTLTLTLFLSRKDPAMRPASHLLRALARESEALGGAEVETVCVDPAMDVGASQRLVRAGVAPGSLVLERDGRVVDSLPLDGGCGEREVVSLLERAGTPFGRSAVYWTKGHGEASFGDYGPEGLSDVARDLALDGYSSRELNLAAGDAVGDDCALVVVAGPKTDFSTAELDRLKAYLAGRGGAGGGRLLALLDSADTGSLQSLLSSLGMRTSPMPASAKARMASESDVIADGFSREHPVSRPFDGLQMVLERPVAFSASAAAGDASAGADRIRFSELAFAGGACVAAAAERGGGEDADLAVRPSRTVAVGDVGFVMNARLRTSANANRDFFLNAVKYLSGRDALTDCGTEADRFVSGMDRDEKMDFAVASAGAFPCAAFLLMAAGTFRRRRRK